MVNSFLTDVLGFLELVDIKTEYNIRGEYADYVIQIARKKHFVIEVKSIQLDLNERHLRQSINYAANEGIDWAVLFNGKCIQIYRVLFGKPLTTQKVIEYDLSDLSKIKKAAEDLVYLSKHSLLKNELEEYWKKFFALTPENISKIIFTKDVVNCIKRELKHTKNLTFKPDDISSALEELINTENKIQKPKTLK